MRFPGRHTACIPPATKRQRDKVQKMKKIAKLIGSCDSGNAIDESRHKGTTERCSMLGNLLRNRFLRPSDLRSTGRSLSVCGRNFVKIFPACILHAFRDSILKMCFSPCNNYHHSRLPFEPTTDGNKIKKNTASADKINLVRLTRYVN